MAAFRPWIARACHEGGRVAFAAWLAALVGLSGLRAASDDLFARPEWFAATMTRVPSAVAESMREGERRLADARANQDEAAEAYARIVLGAARDRRNDMPGALRETAEALAIAERLGQRALLLEARSAHARSLQSAADYASALDLHLKNLELIERFGGGRAHFEVLYGVGTCYGRLDDFERGLDYARRALAEAERTEDANGIAASAALVANIQLRRSDYAAARGAFERALAARRVLGNAMEVFNVQGSLAMLDLRDGKPAEALAALEPVEAYQRTLAGRMQLSTTLLNKTEVLLRLGRLDEALAAAEEARRYAEAMESPTLEAVVYRRLSEVHEARGEPAAALKAARRHFDAQLKVNGEAARRRATDLQTRFDVAQKDQELARLAHTNELTAADARAKAAQLAQNAAELHAKDAELSRGRAQRLALAGGAAAIALAAVAIVLALRARRRADRIALAETQAARHAAEEADALKTRLLGIASHDLKGPLRTMIRGADRVEAAATNPTAVRDGARALRVQGERMFTLVRDLLDLAAIESGGLKLQRAPLDLGSLAQEIVSRHAVRAEEKGQALVCVAPDEAMPPVLADAARLAQALDNLVDNAIKFTPAGGEIRVIVGRRAADGCVAVSDNGPGLRAEDLGRMFQPFQTLSGVPTGGESSTGLGLHITREIATLHGGRVDVDSAPGAGATFTIVLPLSETAALVAT